MVFTVFFSSYQNRGEIRKAQPRVRMSKKKVHELPRCVILRGWNHLWISDGMGNPGPTEASPELHLFFLPPVLDMFDWGKYSFLVLAGG